MYIISISSVLLNTLNLFVLQFAVTMNLVLEKYGCTSGVKAKIAFLL